MVVGSSALRFLNIFGERVGREHDNGQCAQIIPRALADAARGLQTVHDRHLDIHQYYLVKSFFRLGDFMYGVEPIYRRIDSDTGAADDLYGDLTI